MKITVIGIGNIGGTIAERLAASGHEVSVASSRGGRKLIEFAGRIGARSIEVRDAATDAEVVIASVPTEAMPDVAAKLRGRIPTTVALVDTSNYVPGLRDREIPELEDGAVTRSASTRLTAAPFPRVLAGLLRADFAQTVAWRNEKRRTGSAPKG